MKNNMFEYSQVPNSIKENISDNKKLHKYFSQKWGVIKAKNYCGILNIADDEYYILPKISKDNESQNLNIFIYMLMTAYDIKIENKDISTSANKRHNILEIFVHLFTKTLIKELGRGVYKEYITLDENLPVLRGKYLINENLKYNFTNQKIYCEFDEFSPNNALNQFFLYAIKTLSSYVHDKRSIKMCELMLDEVDYQIIDINKLDIHFNRLNERFKKSFEIAVMILKKFIPLFEKDKKSFAFLFDMNELFENFIGKIVQSIEPDAKLKNEKYFGNLKLKPDIIIRDKLLIDTKYKKIKTKDDLATSDKYQMYVYGKNFGIKETILLYPEHIEKICEDLQLGNNEKEVNLKIRSIRLDFDNDYEEFVEEIEKRVKEIIG